MCEVWPVGAIMITLHFSMELDFTDWALEPQLPNETPNNVSVVRLHQILKLRCRDALSLLRSLLHFQITLKWPPPGRRLSRLI